MWHGDQALSAGRANTIPALLLQVTELTDRLAVHSLLGIHILPPLRDPLVPTLRRALA